MPCRLVFRVLVITVYEPGRAQWDVTLKRRTS
jgi:hypothetical protein